MARIFITGSADGLGLLAGQQLAREGHKVVLHARSEARAQDARRKLPDCEAVLIGDVATLAAMHSVADQANAHGRRSEEHTSELQSHVNLVCRLLLEKKKSPTGGESRE